jgi:hypothetical protein
MRTQIHEMSARSTFGWIVLAVTASATTLALIWSFEATRTIAVSSQPWPFAG